MHINTVDHRKPTHAPDMSEWPSQSHRDFVATKMMILLPLGLLLMYSTRAVSLSWGPLTTLTSWVMDRAATGRS